MSSSESSTPSDSIETSESQESSDFAPVGFDGEEFKKLRDLTIGVRPKQNRPAAHKQSDIPPQLTYEGMLKSALSILKKSDATPRLKLALEVRRENRKTLVNANDIARTLNRDPDHLIRFLLAELATTGSVNKEAKLMMKGVFLKNQIQEVLRMYVEQYVVCASCESTDTEIVKENKLFFLSCAGCKSRKYVGNVAEGPKKKEGVKPQIRGMI